MGLVSVVEENPVYQVVMDSDVERYGAVEWVGAGGVSKTVCVPVGIPESAPVERTGLFSQSDEALPILKFFIGCDLFADPTGSKRGVVLVERVAGGVLKMECESAFGDKKDQPRRGDPQMVGRLRGIPGGRERVGNDRVRKILKEIVPGDLDPDNAVVVDGDEKPGMLCFAGNAGCLFLPMKDLT
jgi:hypothetical protein